MATWWWRMVATRGWTSRVASSDPHVLRASWAVILGTLALVMRRSKLRRTSWQHRPARQCRGSLAHLG